MGERNNAACGYLSDKVIFADFLNGTIFKGLQVVQAENLEVCNKDYFLPAEYGIGDNSGCSLANRIQGLDGNLRKNSAGKSSRAGKSGERYRDVMMKDKDGTKYALFGLELQDEVHYAMPLRCMEYDVAEYRRQLKELQRTFRREKGRKHTSAEFLSQMHREDRLNPVITIVFFHGKGYYDGCKDIHGMLNWNEKTEKYKQWVENYHMNLVALEAMQEENFHTGLRELVGVLKRSEDKNTLQEYCDDNAERFKKLDEETFDTICIMIGQKDMLLKKEASRNQEGGIDMCKAIMDIKQDGIMIGIHKGIEQGAVREKERLNTLNKALLADNRIDDLARSVSDEVYQQLLLKEYGLSDLSE